MTELKVAVIPGDGIGPEITEAAVAVMQAAAKKFGLSLSHDSAPAAAAAVDQGLPPLPDHTLKLCQQSDAILCGPFGDPRWDNAPPSERPERAKLTLRKTFDLYANLRPVKPVPALIAASPLKRELIDGTDILIVRELTGGLYFSEPRGYFEDAEGRYGVNTMKYHAWEVERIGKVAFEAAQLRRKRVHSADKANALEVMQLWRETIQKLHDSSYSEVELKHIFIDNCCMQLVSRPKDFDVIVAGNMFGDILSDIGAQLTGSLGMLPSASLGKGVPLFEPVHGSAPDITGTGKANPLAMILTAGMLFTHAAKRPDIGEAIDNAVAKALEKGLRTADIARGDGVKVVGCKEMGEAVLAALEG
ncbi:MAG: 3-isopropylmalate dehydrogenase [Planctomycetes bacterium]|nr:3-isopropylmalate dehydrogenase [Planctomycetota bacterium]MCB9934303.1 3-isopropylmalate dehydrogenase [Planctomycetota bacterium]